MKKCNLIFVLFLLFFCCFISCKNKQVFIPTNTEMSPAVADSTISRYVDIYGRTGLRYLVGANKDSVLLPRFFKIHKLSFKKLLHGQSETLFARLNAKKVVNGSADTVAVSNLLFYDTRPTSNDGLSDTKFKTIVDYCRSCPINCNDDFSTDPIWIDTISNKEANDRIARYNAIYGSKNTVRYMTNEDASKLDSVLIARYYSFSKSDIVKVLDTLEIQEYFYISIGAKKDSISSDYISDLIFHRNQPKPSGDLVLQNDVFYDVTMPCPYICGDEEDIAVK
ncbi:MAG: hypothetical protein AAGG75_13315 [Bacteroidota bacterium]